MTTTETTRRYTLAEIDAGRVTRAGRDLFHRLPYDVQRDDHEGRVRTVCSLLARNGNQAWRLSEEGCNGPANMDYLDQKVYKANQSGDAESMARAVKAARENMDRWEADHERRDAANLARLKGLTAMLSELTGIDWQLDTAGGGLGYALVIPAGLADCRSDCRTGYGGNLDGLFLGDA